MFKNVLYKTLYEKRWFTLGWIIGLIAMALLTMVFFPYFANSGFDQAFANAPQAVQNLIGDSAAYKTVQGYVDAQIFSLRMPMLTLIMSITLFVGLSAGDEDRGTLETLLAQPVSRLRVFSQKLGAGAIVCALGCVGIFAGVWASFIFINGSMSLTRLAAACFGCWVITMLFGALAYAIGMATGSRGATIAIASSVAFLTYLITSLAPAVSILNTAQKFSPFYYYNTPSITTHGIDWSNIGILVAMALVLLVGSLLIFKNRDLVRD